MSLPLRRWRIVRLVVYAGLLLLSVKVLCENNGRLCWPIVIMRRSIVVPCPLTWHSARVAASAATPILCRKNAAAPRVARQWTCHHYIKDTYSLPQKRCCAASGTSMDMALLSFAPGAANGRHHGKVLKGENQHNSVEAAAGRNQWMAPPSGHRGGIDVETAAGHLLRARCRSGDKVAVHARIKKAILRWRVVRLSEDG